MLSLSKQDPCTGLSNQTHPPILFLDAESDARMSQAELRMLQIHPDDDQITH